MIRRIVPWMIVLAAGTGLWAQSVPIRGGGSRDKAAPFSSDLVLCTNIDEKSPFAPLVAVAKRTLKPKTLLSFQGDAVDRLKTRLAELGPDRVIVLAPPETLDITFHLAVLELCASIDDDPFPDFAVGYLTGATPEEGVKFIQATARAGSLKNRFPTTLTEAGPSFGDRVGRDEPLEWCRRLRARTLLHKSVDFLVQNRGNVEGRGFVKLFGPASPRGVESGVDAAWLREFRPRLHPAVLLSSGTDLGIADYYYPEGIKGRSARIPAAESFLLAALSREVGGCVLPAGPGHPLFLDHLVEHMALSAVSLGEAWRRTVGRCIMSSRKDVRDLAGRWRETELPDLTGDLLGMGFMVFGDPGLAPFSRPLDREPHKARAKSADGGWDLSCTVLVPQRFPSSKGLLEKEGSVPSLAFDVPLQGADLTGAATLEALEISAGRRFPKVSRIEAALERSGEGKVLHILIVFDPTVGDPYENARDIKATFRVKR